MNGNLHLVCGPGGGGRSVLLKQHFNAPMHLSKPYWEDNLLVVNAVNATAGLFAGDVIHTDVRVRPGGEMLLTSPSANRVHRTGAGFAQVSQRLHVEAGGWLEVWPSLLIPHAGSDYRQKTRLEVMPGGSLLWLDFFAPGRVASGEAWEFTRLESDLELMHGTRLIARERYSLTPGSAAVSVLSRQFPTAYCASVYAIGTEMPAELFAEIAALHTPVCWLGCTRLEKCAAAVRIVASNSLELTRTLRRLRSLFHDGFGRTVYSFRRV